MAKTNQNQTQVQNQDTEEIIRRVRDLFDRYGALQYVDLWWRRYNFVKNLRRYLESGCEKTIVFATGRVSTSTYDYWLEVRFPCGIGTVGMGKFDDEDKMDLELYNELKKILTSYGINIIEKDYGLDW